MYIEKEGKAYVLHACICLQMETGLYQEPIPGRPETYEDENKRFVLTKKELLTAVSKAIEAGNKYEDSISTFRRYERMGLTYRDIHKITTGEEPGPIGILTPSDRRYEADEDLAFLFTELGEIWQFVFAARDCMAIPNEEDDDE